MLSKYVPGQIWQDFRGGNLKEDENTNVPAPASEAGTAVSSLEIRIHHSSLDKVFFVLKFESCCLNLTTSLLGELGGESQEMQSTLRPGHSPGLSSDTRGIHVHLPKSAHQSPAAPQFCG